MKLFLNPLPYIFQSPGNITDNVKLINNNGSLRKIIFCQFSINLIHIHDNKTDFFFILEALEILLE